MPTIATHAVNDPAPAMMPARAGVTRTKLAYRAGGLVTAIDVPTPMIAARKPQPTTAPDDDATTPTAPNTPAITPRNV
jgi:hypothetical protein